MKSILEARMKCPLCGFRCLLGDGVPCAGGGTGIGCPVTDCGGILVEEETFEVNAA